MTHINIKLPRRLEEFSSVVKSHVDKETHRQTVMYLSENL